MSARLKRWLTPPPQRTAYFCRARQARQRLAGVQHAGAGAVEGVDPARRWRWRPPRGGWRVQRRALGGEQAPGRAADPHHDVARDDAGAVGHPVGDADGLAHDRSGRPARRRRGPATTPGSRAAKTAVAVGVRGDRGRAGDVDAAVRRGQVLGQRAADRGDDGVGVEPGRGQLVARAHGRVTAVSRRRWPAPGRRPACSRRRSSPRRSGRRSRRRRARGSPRASASRGSPRAGPRRR